MRRIYRQGGQQRRSRLCRDSHGCPSQPLRQSPRGRVKTRRGCTTVRTEIPTCIWLLLTWTLIIYRFALQAIQVASASSWNRFLAAYAEYLDSVIEESADRSAGDIRSIQEYLELRRLTIGGYPSFLCFELGLDIPDEVMEHPGIKYLLALVAETVLITNVGTFPSDGYILSHGYD